MKPTIKNALKLYQNSAAVERLRCGKPGLSTVCNTRRGVRRFLQQVETHDLLGNRLDDYDTSWDIPIDLLTPALVRKYLLTLLKDGYPSITALSYVRQLQQLFPRWMAPYYEDCRWKLPKFPVFGHGERIERYRRPSSAQIAGVKNWYENLTLSTDVDRTSENLHLWFAATMMLEFAVRNGDVARLRRSNFVETEGCVYLNYTPHKTALSSGRIVKWPVHPDIWSRLAALFAVTGGETPAFDTEDVFRRLNKAMRDLGFTGTKGAYELRKICIDHVYQRFGAEIAVSISGDDIRTIMRFYADPAQPNVPGVKVSDLL